MGRERELIPRPQVIRERLAYHVRQAGLLRRLLRLSQQADRMRASGQETK